MSHPNRLYNGDIAQDLNNWTPAGNAAFIASQGFNELGAISLPGSGDSVAQDFSIGVGRKYMVEVAGKAVSGSGNVTLTIKTDDGVTIYTATISLTTSWQLWQERVGLPFGTFTLTLAYADVACYLDDVSVAYVVKTRAELAKAVHDRLGVLATNASVSLLPVSGEGSWYAEPIDVGLRSVQATDPAGRPDVRYLDAGIVDACINEIELEALHKLHRYWSTKTDYSIGQRSESQSQITAAIDRLIGTAVGGRAATAGRAVQQRKLIHRGTFQ